MASVLRVAIERYLDRLLSHSKLSAAERHELLSLTGRVRHARPNDDLVMPERVVNHAVLVADGLLARFDTMRNGARQITALHIPGDMCDLHSVVAPVPGWGIVALSAATVVELPHAELRKAAMEHPGIAIAFWRDTTLDASILAKWVANNGRKRAVARLAHLLCELGLRMERIGIGTRTEYSLPLTQEAIGDVTSLTNVHVNRMLRALKSEGVAEVARPLVRIYDWERLASLAEFTPAYLLRGVHEADVTE